MCKALRRSPRPWRSTRQQPTGYRTPPSAVSFWDCFSLYIAAARTCGLATQPSCQSECASAAARVWQGSDRHPHPHALAILTPSATFNVECNAQTFNYAEWLAGWETHHHAITSLAAVVAMVLVNPKGGPHCILKDLGRGCHHPFGHNGLQKACTAYQTRTSERSTPLQTDATWALHGRRPQGPGTAAELQSEDDHYFLRSSRLGLPTKPKPPHAPALPPPARFGAKEAPSWRDPWA